MVFLILANYEGQKIVNNSLHHYKIQKNTLNKNKVAECKTEKETLNKGCAPNQCLELTIFPQVQEP